MSNNKDSILLWTPTCHSYLPCTALSTEKLRWKRRLMKSCLLENHPANILNLWIETRVIKKMLCYYRNLLISVIFLGLQANVLDLENKHFSVIITSYLKMFSCITRHPSLTIISFVSLNILCLVFCLLAKRRRHFLLIMKTLSQFNLIKLKISFNASGKISLFTSVNVSHY